MVASLNVSLLRKYEEICYFYKCFSWFPKLSILVCSSCSVWSTWIDFLIQLVIFNGKGYNPIVAKATISNARIFVRIVY